jgi:hypothetical protein
MPRRARFPPRGETAGGTQKLDRILAGDQRAGRGVQPVVRRVSETDRGAWHGTGSAAAQRPDNGRIARRADSMAAR